MRAIQLSYGRHRLLLAWSRATVDHKVLVTLGYEAMIDLLITGVERERALRSHKVEEE